MAILPAGNASAARRSTLAAKPSQSGFVVPKYLDAGAEAPDAPTEAAAPSPISAHSLLALQEAEPDNERNRRARRHGLDMLDALRQLQQDLLEAGADTATLHRLDRLAATVPVAADTALRAVLEQLSIRARVELARIALGRANPAL